MPQTSPCFLLINLFPLVKLNNKRSKLYGACRHNQKFHRLWNTDEVKVEKVTQICQKFKIQLPKFTRVRPVKCLSMCQLVTVEK